MVSDATVIACAICAVEGVAIICGVNGALLVPVLTIAAGLGGYQIGKGRNDHGSKEESTHKA